MPSAADNVSQNPFWDFTLRVYGAPGVQAACLTLQDRFGLDVNLALYCLWCGAGGPGRLDETALQAAGAAVQAWQQDVIQALRAVRNRLKQPPWSGYAGAPDLRKQVLAVELAAEKISQDRLLQLAGTARVPADRAIAAANLGLYLERSGAGGASEAMQAVEALLAGAFT